MAETIFTASQKTVDSKGLKTTKTIKTEDPNIIRRILEGTRQDSIKAEVHETTKKTKSSKKSSSKKVLSIQAPKIVISNKKDSKKKLNRNINIPSKGIIVHNSNNLNDVLIRRSNHNSFSGNRGSNIKKDYEAYRKKIENSSLSILQKKRLLDKLYKLYESILKYDSEFYSSMVSGPARYPQAKMERIASQRMEASKKFIEWWKTVENQIENSQIKTKEELATQKNKANNDEVKRIKDGFELYYKRALERVPEYEKSGRDISKSSEVALAQHYVTAALKVDTKLYKELFEKLNKIAKYRKNTNHYKIYNDVINGSLSSEKLQKQDQTDNSVIYKCSEYTISNLKIQAGKRIAIKFVFYPKPQLVYALKKRGYIWYSSGGCYICKPEKFDLDWAKDIKNKYSKYMGA